MSLYSIYLDPTIHRRGIGMKLLRRLIDDCETRGYRQMIAVIGEGEVRISGGAGYLSPVQVRSPSARAKALASLSA